MTTPVDLTYPAILDTVRTCIVPGRTESHALLVWFLQHYFRLDEVEAQDSVCDGPDDKGIDAIYIDEIMHETRRKSTPSRSTSRHGTLSDST